jgi:hypothetical protein
VVDSGVVLVTPTPGVSVPAKAEILSTAGDLLAEDDEFDDLV